MTPGNPPAVSHRARDAAADLIEQLALNLHYKDAWLDAADALRKGAKGRVECRFVPEAFARFERETFEEAARIADPPLMHRKGKPGLWRLRRAAIAAAIRQRINPQENGNG